MPVAYRASAQVFGSTTSTVITIPATVQVGDMLLLQAAGGWAPTAPAGWTVDFSDTSSSNVQCFVAYKTAGAGDAGATVTVTWNNAYNHVVNLIAVSGAVGIRSRSHIRSSNGNSALTGPLSTAADDLIVYMGGIRQATSTITLDRGTTDLSARDGSNNFSGIVGHEAITVGGAVGANFTATGGSGYLYSQIVIDGGGIIPTVAVVSANYVEALTAGVPYVRTEGNYVEVLGGGLPKAQVGASYLEILTNTPTIQTEAVYAEVLSSGSPLLQAEGVYAEVLSSGAPYLQTEAMYAEVLVSVFGTRKGWGILV